ncbi:Phosphatidylethanolamine-binding protein PEBP [Penicillium sp. DV-2018c]|nr:Phosphatidylethanolamine-binding protein PEBP [Penicillium sp. DV-2018c]KAJ5575812.1 Phosphatidylethanolamine-binding protein PEBP [Penicillium sp. DV-2018c]
MPSNKHFEAGQSLIENDKSKILGLTINEHENVQPGTYIPRNVAQEPPKLFFSGADPASTYMVVCLDIDAPFQTLNFLGPVLHWIQSDLKVTSDGELKSDAPFVADYIGPAPPPVGAAHRYLFFLYEQPANFDHTAHAPVGGKKLGAMSRMRYDLETWAEMIGLGPIVAFNYFTSN